MTTNECNDQRIIEIIDVGRVGGFMWVLILCYIMIWVLQPPTPRLLLTFGGSGVGIMTESITISELSDMVDIPFHTRLKYPK